MDAPLARLQEIAYTLFRIVAGFLFACHGAQKLFGLFGGKVQPLGTKVWAAGAIELSCGLLVMLGIVAGLAAFVACGEMAVAYFTVHWPRGFWPITNAGELAALYCFVFLFIASRGSGRWALRPKALRVSSSRRS
jgi:putative oxidoreductase